MSSMLRRILVIASCLLIVAPAAYSQSGRPGGRPGGPPPRGGRPGPPPPFDDGNPDRRGPGRRGPMPGLSFLSSEMRFSGRVVKDAPFTADSVSESTQVLADGSKITRRMTAKIARDSMGRTRREQELNVLGPFNVAGEPPHLIFIDDPVAGAHYVMNVGEKEARKFPYDPARRPEADMPGPPEENVESLGIQVVQGVEARGTRSTVVIPEGRIGNDRPLNIVSELWESTDLKVPVLSRHSDPRTGITEYRLLNIERGEPSTDLFNVPPDYNLKEEKPRFDPDRRPRGPKRRIPGLF